MKQISETEKQNREKLFRLMQENPDLPVIPFVDTDVVAGDEFGSWMGNWGPAKVDEFLITPDEWEAVILKSNADVERTLELVLTEAQFDVFPETDEERKKHFDALPWTKAIIVFIDTPEV